MARKLDIARVWLRAALSDGEAHVASELLAQAKAEGIKVRTLQLAASYEAAIKAVYGSKGIQAWQWKLK
ncbi:MAG TPA: hypothetical protein VH599_07445 [Ktedonobacterales bacterium]|jgi:hypothetical protein